MNDSWKIIEWELVPDRQGDSNGELCIVWLKRSLKVTAEIKLSISFHMIFCSLLINVRFYSHFCCVNAIWCVNDACKSKVNEPRTKRANYSYVLIANKCAVVCSEKKRTNQNGDGVEKFQLSIISIFRTNIR